MTYIYSAYNDTGAEGALDLLLVLYRTASFGGEYSNRTVPPSRRQH